MHLDDFTADELHDMLDRSAKMKQQIKEKRNFTHTPFDKLTMGMVFAKASMRTRVSFEVGFHHLGGKALYLGPAEHGIGGREAVKDVARVLSRYHDIIMARLYAHEDILELARYSQVPIINGLTDFNHPCQIMADALTILEDRGSIENCTVAYVGDGNNIVHSWIRLAKVLPFTLVVVTPPGYEPSEPIPDSASAAGKVIYTNDISAVQGADYVYTDVWASMGQKEEFEQRVKDFRGYTVNAHVMSIAGPQAGFLHCLPAERGVECEDEVMESDRSLVFAEAENRMWAQMGIMDFCMEGYRP